MVLKLTVAIWFVLAGFEVQAAHTQVELILAAETVRPGDTVLAGIHLRMDPNWHTYWRNPGTTGSPTEIRWTLPAGISAGEALWPVPEKLPDPQFTTYIYENEVVLLVPLTLAADLKPGPVELKAEVEWLECAVQCVNGKATVSARLTVGSETKPSDDADLFATWQKRLPLRGDGSRARAWWEQPAKGENRPLILEWDSTTPVDSADFFPGPSEAFEIGAITEKLAADPGKVRLRAMVKRVSEWPRQVAGLLLQKGGAQQAVYEVMLPVESGAPAPGSAEPSAESTRPAAAPSHSLAEVLLFAFLGGMILNIMPCVLPVIALKILGFVTEGRKEPAHVRRLGLIYALGVLASFLVLAGLVIGVKAAGHQAGWGIQFGDPRFVLAMAALITLVALNLFGLFEVTLGGEAMSAAGSLAAKHGGAGAFFNGILATVLATPCTAPFLSVALGFAFAQPAGIIILVLLTVGLGLAAPYVVLSWNPAWLKFLPKPGAWMEKFKIAMGFPMLLTVLWLLSLLPPHYGQRSWWAGVFLVLVALAAWVYGEFVQRGGQRRLVAAVVCLLLLSGGYAWVLEGELNWRVPGADDNSHGASEPQGVAWRPWSPEAVAAARAQHHPVLVDFTATWCLTCNATVKPALENEAVQSRFRQLGVVTLVADYSKRPAAITEEMARWERSAVPLVVLYPADPGKPGLVLPDPVPLLPPSHYAGTIAAALDKAGR